MRYIAFQCAYRGDAFCGSQRQLNGRSVQGELERAVAIVCKQPTPVSLAGRTDAGVHATGQVGRFTTDNRIPVEKIPLALNAHLDRACRVVKAWEVEEQFHPRFSAVSRQYHYTFDTSEIANPLLRQIAGHAPGTLNVEAMHDSAQVLVGEHDFAAWQSAGSPNGPTVRRMLQIAVARGEAFGAPLVTVELEANAFLYVMARNITGALLRVGQGTLDKTGLQRLHEGLDRTQCPPPAPPQGLCLVEVKYKVRD